MKKLLGITIFISLIWAYIFLLSNLFSCSIEQKNPYEFADTDQLTATSESEGTDEKLDITSEYLDVFINPEDGEPRCQNIDFLFVIDNSGSMGDDQQNLISNFPVFVEGIENGIPSLKSYHVGVITTDAYNWNQPECTQLGALVTSTGNYNEYVVCGDNDQHAYVDGYRFMTNNDDLSEKFSCAANVGTSGNGYEQQLMSMIQAVEFYINSPGQCNEGFIREDTLLVIVLLTDEEDHSGDSAKNFHDHLVWVKGNKKDIVVLSIVSIGQAPILVEFTSLFGEQGFIGEISESSYELFFKNAISVIFRACYEEYPPEGYKIPESGFISYSNFMCLDSNLEPQHDIISYGPNR